MGDGSRRPMADLSGTTVATIAVALVEDAELTTPRDPTPATSGPSSVH